MGELDALEQYLFAQDTVDETVLHLHRQAVKAALDRAEAALRIIADGTSYDPEGSIPVRPRNIARAALRAYEDADKVADAKETL